jgi:pyruvate carboxylase
MRAASEMGIRTVAIYSNEDRFALHRFKADESYLVGAGKKPIQAYLDIDDIIRVAKEAAGRRHPPGLRLPVREPGLRRGLRAAGIVFIGPKPEVMRTCWATRSRRASWPRRPACRWCRPPARCRTTSPRRRSWRPRSATR